ncbi:unnamed protein product [marine sediment metagenome]|uniref:PEGA domain-containing protein n=1 Tax=marine sediment metagenome TaxID=412755 RepID=X1F513_9ZZZZ
MVKAQTSYIDVYVYDAITFAPIVGADVDLYDGFYMFLSDGPTDINGFIQFTALDSGDYYVEVYATGYQWNVSSVTIVTDGDGELVEFYQEPIFGRLSEWQNSYYRYNQT